MIRNIEFETYIFLKPKNNLKILIDNIVDVLKKGKKAKKKLMTINPSDKDFKFPNESKWSPEKYKTTAVIASTNTCFIVFLIIIGGLGIIRVAI